MNLTWHKAGTEDIALLSGWNRELIRDEGHRNTMDVPRLADRMRRWLAGEYEAVIFHDPQPVGYALYKKEPGHLYLRQFYVVPEKRRRGIGRSALTLLKTEIWPTDLRMTVDVLCANKPAIDFWRSVGYRDYCLTLETMPETQPSASAVKSGE